MDEERLVADVRAGGDRLDSQRSVNDLKLRELSSAVISKLGEARLKAASLREHQLLLEAARQHALDAKGRPPRIAIELSAERMRLEKAKVDDANRMDGINVAIAKARETLDALRAVQSERANMLQPLKSQTAKRLALYEKCLGVAIGTYRYGDVMFLTLGFWQQSPADNPQSLRTVYLRLGADDTLRIVSDQRFPLPQDVLDEIAADFDDTQNFGKLLVRLRKILS